MRIHHLNCGTLTPPGESMVCHVLLLEVGRHLVLVDTGFGSADVRAPGRLGPVRHLLRPALRPEETAVARTRALGLDPAAVSDVVLTHGDLDHAGGLVDLPHAQVHLLAAEHRAIRHPRGLLEAQRYRPSQWAHGPRITPHRPGAVRWKGFEGCVDLSAVAPGMLLVPMPGHTAGHAGVAIPTGSGWLLHAGDAFHSALSLREGSSRLDVRVRQGLLAHDEPALRSTQRRLGALARRDPAVQIINSHDRKLWEQA
ncbi:MBL fold metallo-hydrolase [Brachybacterium sp. p3-SID957]|uniref:MBL fold metallo-hydrolase n=1 Tax=Brachybacterium sp. p3-SID957 TaxID=2916049 RepID=UPI00223A696E|nr:MBL fold metallo-hydrolase [Brachybacterium sp. p3-SID957]MCT1774838.1 MBL fold metallo-hydrolase [Brachybacterium sp. p3-SID957]